MYPESLLPTFNIPSHIEYILFELLKNAMRAVVERHTGSTLPPIEIHYHSNEKVINRHIGDCH